MEPIVEQIPIALSGESYDVSVKLRRGSPHVLLCLHGIGDCKEDFDGIWERPGFESYTVAAMDWLGFGESSKPDGFRYRIEDHAEAAARVLERLEAARVSLIGHSVGGAIAVMLAARLDGRLDAFINAEGNLIGEDCGIITRDTVSVPYDIYVAEHHPKRSARLVAERGTAYANEAMLPLAFYRTAQSVVSHCDSGVLLRTFLGLACRKAYVFGDWNRNAPIIGELDGIEMIEISGAGHRMMDDNPAGFYGEIARFLGATSI